MPEEEVTLPVVHVPPSKEHLDMDVDGLSVDQETALGTNPSDYDTDSDGLPDPLEIQMNTDPGRVGAARSAGAGYTSRDSDGDGQFDGAEYFAGSDPADASKTYVDADNDGMADAWEVRNDVSSPGDDPDGDLLTNVNEFLVGTDPKKWDTDGDSISDFTESAAVVSYYKETWRTNPLQKNPVLKQGNGAKWPWPGFISEDIRQKIQASVALRKQNVSVVPQTGTMFSCWVIGDQQSNTRLSDAGNEYPGWKDIASFIASPGGDIASLRPICTLNVGDMVDVNRDIFWANFLEGQDVLDASGLLNFFTLGNHDMGSESMGYFKGFPDAAASRDQPRYTELANYFMPASTWQAWSTWCGSYDEKRTENVCHRFFAGRRFWVVLSIEYNPRDAVLAWADGIAKANADANVIVLTHSYNSAQGLRSESGARIWEEVIRGNQNVVAVVSGHYLGTLAKYVTNDANRQVLELLFNYQGYDKPDADGAWNGDWFLLLTFYPNEGKIVARSFNSRGESGSVADGHLSFSKTGFTM